MAKSEYLQREEAAKKQLGAKGVKKRVKQLPTAARASLREMTGIDISRKGVSVDPIGLAMAVSPFKLLKASKALRAAGQVGRAAAVEARLGAKTIGRNIPKDYSYFPKGLASGPKTVEGKLRSASESVFPRLPSRGGDAPGLLRGQRDLRTFDRYADPINEGAGRFKGQDLLENMIQGSKTRRGMKSVAEARALATRKAARRGR
jgi:hypothetical protein